MPKGSQYICQNCGASQPKWSGKCQQCDSWNSLVEETTTGIGSGGAATKNNSIGKVVETTSLHGKIQEAPRTKTDIGEFDRVTGGGLVAGSAIIVGGDPGIGKSTLLLQVAANLTKNKKKVVYVSGEEAIAQVRLRAKRLKCTDAPVELIAETNVENIIATLKSTGEQSLVVVDSIQTLWTDTLDSAPGTVGQVRASAQAMVRYAKQTNTTVILVGHVTKEGQIAGPRVVEHIVDAVLYFEGEQSTVRVLRTVKNRFGATDEIGVFEMSDEGLKEISNPSEKFLGDGEPTIGTAVFAAIEGQRPLLVEVQALVTGSTLVTPRRAVVGWDATRLAMITAVLQSHCNVRLASSDIYLTVAGGLKISEPAADIAVAAALLSSIKQKPTKGVWFGEISLSGKLRPASNANARLKEAKKLGFNNAFLAETSEKIKTDMKIKKVSHLKELVTESNQDSKKRSESPIVKKTQQSQQTQQQGERTKI